MKQMNRRRKFLLNSISSLFYQLIALICGFVLPRMFLVYYGSAANGLVSSITQFLGFISLAECGVGAVVKSTLYKPLAEKNSIEISKIVISSERFFRRIAYLLIGYTAILMVAYPFITLDSFDYTFALLLILIISIDSFAQYYFGMTYRLLLNADQLGFVQFTINGVTLIINTITCVILIKSGVSILLVKLTTALIYLVQPLVMATVAKRRYKIDRSIVLTKEPIEQKWNGLAQHIASVVLGNTDIAVLTLLSTLENVSIYSVYFLVLNGVKQIVISLTNGMQALLGNMLAKQEMKQLNQTFEGFEWIVHTAVTSIFAITAVLIVPFIRVYTKDISDANYIVPLFGYLITLAQAAYCIRLPYNIMALAAGHFKQTQNSAIIEAGINIVVSVALVFSFGIIGVAIGTLVAMIYRTCYLSLYISKNIIYRDIKLFMKHIIVDAISVIFLLVIIKLWRRFFVMEAITYLSWLLLAIKVSVAGLISTLAINCIFYSNLLHAALATLKRKAVKSNSNSEFQ